VCGTLNTEEPKKVVKDLLRFGAPMAETEQVGLLHFRAQNSTARPID